MTDGAAGVPPISAASVREGPKCWRFGFALKEPREKAERENRRRATVLAVAEWLPGVDIVDDWDSRSGRYVVLETMGPVCTATALSFASELPAYVPGSFRVDGST